MFLAVSSGEAVARTEPGRCSAISRRAGDPAAVARAARPDLVGGRLAAPRPHGPPSPGMNLQSSTLKDQRVRQAVPRPAGRADPDLPRRVERSGPRAQPRVSVSRSIFALTDKRDWTYFGARNQDEDQIGFIDAEQAGDLRPHLRRRAGQADRAAQGGRGDRRRRHPAAHGPEPARRRIQRSRDRVDPHARGPGSRLALVVHERARCLEHARRQVDVGDGAGARRRPLRTGDEQTLVTPPPGSVSSRVN